jgi:hypothetical protein
MSTTERPTGDERPTGTPEPGRGMALLVPVLALMALAALAATGTGLLLPRAELSPPATVAVRLVGLGLVVAGLVGLLTRWGRGARVSTADLPMVVAVAAGIFAALAALSVAHSPVTAGGDGSWTAEPPGGLPSDVEPDSTTTTTAPTTTTEAPSEPRALEEDTRPDIVGLLIMLLIAMLLVVALVGFLLAWGVRPVWRRGRPLPVGPELPVDAQSAEAGLAASLAAVVEGDDARAAIVAAYARLLEALAGAGGGRRPEEAPHEHLYRVLGPLGVRPEPVHRLAELFVMARFSEHEITDEHRATAVTLLETALGELRAATAAAAAAAAAQPDDRAATAGVGAGGRAQTPGPAWKDRGGADGRRARR